MDRSRSFGAAAGTVSSASLGILLLLGASPGSAQEPAAGKLVAAATAGEWPQWRGPRSDGISRETGLLKTWPEDGPPVLWKAELGGGYASVAVAHGRVFTHTAKNKKEEIVLCYDAESGKELWRYPYPCDYSKQPAAPGGFGGPGGRGGRFDSGPRATPAVDGAFVYTIGMTGIVLCLEEKTGKKVWEADLEKIGERRSAPHFGYCSSPLVAGEHVYVLPGGSKGNSIAALDKKTGKVAWKALDDPPSHSSPVLVEFGGTPQVMFLTGSALVGVAPKDGKLLWRFPYGGGGGGPGGRGGSQNAATPVYADGRVFVTPYVGGFGMRGGADGGDGGGRGGDGLLVELKKDGEPKQAWKSKAISGYGTPVLYEGHLYGFGGGRLRCVEVATGKTTWDRAALGKGTLTIADGHLIVLGERGELVLAEASPKKYTEQGKCRPLSGSCLAVPVLAGGRLYLRNERTLLALDLKGAGRKE